MVLENFRKMAADKRDTVPQSAVQQLTESDRILLSVLLSDPESHGALLPELKQVNGLELSPAKHIYAALFALADSGAPLSLASLHDRLEDPDRKMLSACLLSQNANEHGVTLEAARACLSAWKRRDAEQRVAQLKARIREAERNGDLATAISLTKNL